MAGSVTNITERKSREEEIRFLAFHDALTGLHNSPEKHEIPPFRPEIGAAGIVFIHRMPAAGPVGARCKRRLIVYMNSTVASTSSTPIPLSPLLRQIPCPRAMKCGFPLPGCRTPASGLLLAEDRGNNASPAAVFTMLAKVDF